MNQAPEDQFEQTHTTHRSVAKSTALRSRARLLWTDATGPNEVIVTETMLLGSTPGCGVMLSDKTVSRVHAEVVMRPDGLWVRDLGSKNGTFVDGVQVESARLFHDSLLRVGLTELMVDLDADPVEVELWPTSSFGPLLGQGIAMRTMFARLARIAASAAAVLVEGETGTGKELVAQAIHEASRRARAPYVVVDCAALPENLLETELFGHARGAFTGAHAARAGAFEVAEGGTLFLDEIGELPLAMQPKLLRVLESRTARRIGETSHRNVDVRVIAATHRDLRSMVASGAFREDLYFRLAVLPIRVPALRERREDLVVLARHFAGADELPSDITDALASRPWLGNVRELRNFVERVRTLGTQEALAMAPKRTGSSFPPPNGPPALDLDVPFKELRERWLDHLEREYLRGLLGRLRGNVSAVAQAAQVDRTYVHRLVRKHQL